MRIARAHAPHSLLRFALTVSFACSVACAKVNSPGGEGSGGSSGSADAGGSGNRPGSGGRMGGSGTGGGLISSGPDAAVCQMATYKFEPKIPTVVLLVDRSGSMFDCISTPSNAEPTCADMADTSWTKLKDGILPVVNQLQGQVRFGFGTVTGSNPRFAGMCPVLNAVPPSLDNYAAIAGIYNTLPPAPNSTQSGMKWETPTRQVLEMVGNQLAADTTPGDKYVLFITDGEPDYCGDGNALCPPDAVVWQLQLLKQKGITTIVFGLKATIAQDLPMGVLEAFANAGAGEPTLPPLRGTNPKIEDFYDQCLNPGAPADEAPGGWTRDLIASGKPMMRGTTLGTYAAAAGPTRPYRPDVTNQQQLVDQLSAALSGVKSCTFDLGNIDGKSIRVNTTLLDRARVLIQGTAVPLDQAGTNGWHMISATQLELVGTACSDWRKPENLNIDFQFPCEIIIVD